MKFIIIIAVFLEKVSILIKKTVSRKAYKDFLNKYGLQDSIQKPKKDIRFNSYEGTNMYLIEALIKSGEISKKDKVLDIGCGAGIFLLYLADNEFKYLEGYEIDDELYKICLKNCKIVTDQKKNINISICHGDATVMDINKSVTIIYLFNPFYDKTTYSLWLKKVRESVLHTPRKLKIIILFPTVASMGAIRECEWLYEKGRVFSDAQVCSRCVNFLIYETKEGFLDENC